MSRRASQLFQKENPDKPRPKVRFPDELVFLDSVKENDMESMHTLLRRASVQIDINAIANSGMTPIHSACIEGNFGAVRLLVRHGADVNKQDADTWTPLHAACAEGHADIVRYLLKKGADKNILTDEGERPIDLVDPQDLQTVRVMLADQADAAIDQSDEHDDDDSDYGDDDDGDEEAGDGSS